MRYDLFPTPVWHIEGAPLELIDELYQGAYRFKEKQPSTTRSNEGGYQTPFLDWKDFHPQGIEYIQSVVKETLVKENSTDGPLEVITLPPNVDFKIESWWYNINSQSHWNVPHTHPTADFALVLYLTDSDGLLTLLDPYAYRGIYPQIKNMNAKKGDVVIFPADLYHYVKPNQKEEDRISISMNLNIHI